MDELQLWLPCGILQRTLVMHVALAGELLSNIETFN